MCKAMQLFELNNVQGVRKLQATQPKENVEKKDNDTTSLGKASTQANITEFAAAVKAVKANSVQEKINANIPSFEDIERDFWSGNLDPRSGEINRKYNNGSLKIYIGKNWFTGKKDLIYICYYTTNSGKQQYQETTYSLNTYNKKVGK